MGKEQKFAADEKQIIIYYNISVTASHKRICTIVYTIPNILFLSTICAITVIIILYLYIYYIKQQRPSLYRHRTERGGSYMVETSAIVILRHEENHAYISTTYAVHSSSKL